MANSDQKLTIQIAGNTVELERSLKDVSSAISASRREAGALKDELKFSPGNVELLTKRHQELTQAMELSKVKAEILREDLNKIDPQVDPKGFYKLSRQLNIAEADARKFGRQLDVANAQLERAQSTAATFKFNTNNGIKEFRNDITGVEAAMAALGGKRSILNFNTAGKSVDELKKSFATANSAIELVERKSELLKAQLSNINPTVNPKGFAEVQNKINDLSEDLDKLNKTKTDIKIALHGQGESVNSAQSLGARIVSAITGRVKSLRGDLSRNVSDDIKASSENAKSHASIFQSVGGAIVSAIKGGAKGVSSIGRGILDGIKSGVSGLGSVFSGILNHTVKPFANAIKNTLGTVIQGGLLTIGNAITNKLFGIFNGVKDSLEETNVAAKSLSSVLSFNNVDSGTIEAVTKDMAEFAKQTTYSAGQMDKVVAALSSSNVEASQAGSLAKSIASAYSLLGDGSQKISDIGVIFSQINSAGKLMTQDFNQLRNAGIGGALKKQIEEMYPEILAGQKSFNDAMAKGAISAEMVNAAITKIGTSDQAKKAATVPKTMGDAFASLSETIGQKFNGVYKNLTDKGINSVGKITEYIENMDVSGIADQLESIFNFGEKIGNSIKDAFKDVDFSAIQTKIQEVFDKIAEAVKAAIDVVKPLFDAIDFNKVAETGKEGWDAIINTLKRVGDFMKALFETEGMKKFIDLLISSVLGTFKLINDTLSNEKVAESMEKIGKSLGDGLGTISDGVKAIFGDGDGLSQIFVSVFTTVSQIVAGIVGFMEKLANNEAFRGIIKDIIDTIKHVFDTLKSIGEKIDFKKLFGGGEEGEGDEKGGIGGKLQQFLDIIKEITGAIENIDFKSIGDGLEYVAGVAGYAFSGILNTVLEIIRHVTNIGKAFTEGFGENSEDSAQSRMGGFELLRDVLKEIGETIKWITDKLGELEGIFETLLPPELFKNLGKLLDDFLNPIWSTVKFLIDGIKDFVDGALKQFTETLGGNPLEGVNKALDDLHKNLQPVIDNFNNFLDAAKPAFKVIADIIGKVVGFALGSAIKLLLWGIEKVVNLISWLVKKIREFGEWIGGLTGGIVGTIAKFLGLDSKSSGASYSAVSYNAASASYANYSAISNNRNDVAINVYAQPGMDITSLARAVRHEFTVGTA